MNEVQVVALIKWSPQRKLCAGQGYPPHTHTVLSAAAPPVSAPALAQDTAVKACDVL
jgi:hypothetical protein